MATEKSTIHDVVKISGQQTRAKKPVPAWWVILDCGHWYKWTGPNKPPPVDFDQWDCIGCQRVEVAPPPQHKE